jgi:hypothetical protein
VSSPTLTNAEARARAFKWRALLAAGGFTLSDIADHSPRGSLIEATPA